MKDCPPEQERRCVRSEKCGDASIIGADGRAIVISAEVLLSKIADWPEQRPQRNVSCGMTTAAGNFDRHARPTAPLLLCRRQPRRGKPRGQAITIPEMVSVQYCLRSPQFLNRNIFHPIISESRAAPGEQYPIGAERRRATKHNGAA